MNLFIKPIIKGFLTFIPGIRSILPQRGTGGTNSAEYCYEVWLKHITLARENGMSSIPKTLAELGPGDSIGIGLAAMLSGVDNYFALDVAKYSDISFNVKIFDELVELFEKRSPRPSKGWPNYDQYLDNNLFPSHILTDHVLNISLSKSRIEKIRNTILNPGVLNDEIKIVYKVPWSDKSVIDEGTVDFIISHSVLEHVVDLKDTYQALFSWLKPNGMMSHQIDFTAHGLAKKWNGYRAYSETLWKVIVGKRPFLINRQPYSVHLNMINEYKFNVVCNLKKYRQDEGISRSQLSKSWQDISDDDLDCSGTFIQAKK